MIIPDSKAQLLGMGAEPQDRELPPLPSETSDNPPPYESAGQDAAPEPAVAGLDVAPTNNLVIHTRRSPITGKFRINPEDTIPYAPDYLRRVNKRRCYKSRPTLNASFYTKHAPISLDLGIVSRSHENMTSFVEVNSRSGNITINLSLEAPKHINLDVWTRRGNVVVFLPKNYFGAVKVYSKHGQILFLPALSRVMRLAKMNERDAMIFVGQAGASDPHQIEDNSTKHADFCQLASRHGDVVVGLRGEDTYKREDNGFWKKLGTYLRGEALPVPPAPAEVPARLHV
ncbi:hypothetical protein GLOTRDRAFT_110849 [Gloeophyllum trabeum ATCC 11539]|uniref:DUF7330 domain-containing protein n=1 Tax=Gloeophyllum trabeum (strain ATCC 11539 / FP-39264 / Madison 617) TaxID=670483 RepID=S7RPS9_GLOTA|nr:uncharacterized protein GLOTRDRAFT_110849 [Gloeophyllum trabeum ATCC 11539]EPQ56575.1 hypothetical protein GLOTRDRAFT_110849 [Gloeophyllum trabeum ATCC 11539]